MYIYHKKNYKNREFLPVIFDKINLAKYRVPVLQYMVFGPILEQLNYDQKELKIFTQHKNMYMHQRECNIILPLSCLIKFDKIPLQDILSNS